LVGPDGLVPLSGLGQNRWGNEGVGKEIKKGRRKGWEREGDGHKAGLSRGFLGVKKGD